MIKTTLPAVSQIPKSIHRIVTTKKWVRKGRPRSAYAPIDALRPFGSGSHDVFGQTHGGPWAQAAERHFAGNNGHEDFQLTSASAWQRRD